MPALLNTNEAASALGVSYWTIRNYVKAGLIQPVRIGNRIKFEPAELQRFIEASKASQ